MDAKYREGKLVCPTCNSKRNFKQAHQRGSFVYLQCTHCHNWFNYVEPMKIIDFLKPGNPWDKGPP